MCTTSEYCSWIILEIVSMSVPLLYLLIALFYKVKLIFTFFCVNLNFAFIHVLYLLTFG